MKNINFSCFFLCMLLLASCRKSGDFLPSKDSEEENITTLKHGQPNEKQFTLSSITLFQNNQGPSDGGAPSSEGPISINFLYNIKGQLDSVAFSPRVVGGIGVDRIKGRISSVRYTSPFDLPSILESGFDYDKHENITGFDLTNLREGGPVTPVKITYDQGHARRITLFNTANPSMNTNTFINYNGNNIVRWTTVSGSTRTDTKYTFDRKHLNPVYFIDDMLVIVSFVFGFDFLQESENVTTSKFDVQSQHLLTFQNFYDRKGRIIRKVWKEPSLEHSDSLTYRYVN